MGDELLDERAAKKLLGCTGEELHRWIEDGSLWAINIAIDNDPEECLPCYRISKASALRLHQDCRKDAEIRKRGQGR